MLKHIVARTYKPLLVKYLSKKRVYRYGNLRLEIPPQVFHPGFFFSTQILLQYIIGFELRQRTFLELGAGSGLISMYASGKGAKVTATDINPIAIEYLHKNSVANHVEIDIIESDLFAGIPVQKFDIIAINPPYYKKQAQSPLEQAWYCGENGEYFWTLFQQLESYLHPDSLTIMVCCEGCDMEMINEAAKQNGFLLKLIITRQNILEKNFIFKIERLA